jgi:enterochelin esterase-like enzyme
MPYAYFPESLRKNLPLFLMLLLMISSGCKRKLIVEEDQIYSKHLQAHFKLHIISTPMPKQKSELNLLIVNDGQDFDPLKIKAITDSLYHKKRIEPLLIVGVDAESRMDIYGVAGIHDYQNRGSRADKYDAFITDELYPYIKKKTAIRKFNSVAIAGCSLGGLSAMDIAFNHQDKFDKVGVFSGSFWWRDVAADAPSYSDEHNRIFINKIKTSRKKSSLRYWLYIGGIEEKDDRDKDSINDALDDTRDLVSNLKTKYPDADVTLTENKTGTHDYNTWSRYLPDFLVWAYGR